MQPRTRLDHLVLVVPELEPAMERIRRAWGCDVLAGGRHPDWGSWNALVPLAGGAYLEVIAPHPEPPGSGRRVFGLDRLRGCGLRTWAVRPEGGAARGPAPESTRVEPAAREAGESARSDLDALAAEMRRAGVDPGRLIPGSRRTRDGVLLEWTLSDPFAPRMGARSRFSSTGGRRPTPPLRGPLA